MEAYFGITLAYGAVAFLVTAVVHLAFALAVWRAGGQLVDRGSGTMLVGPFIWGLATPVGGVVAAGVFWMLHYSTLRRRAAMAEPLRQVRLRPAGHQAHDGALSGMRHAHP